MTDFGQLLLQKLDDIQENWVNALWQDQQIETTQELTYKAVLDSMPQVLKALASMLSEIGERNIEQLVEASLEHGIVRADQGFDPAEIAREYRLLRSEIFSALEADLLSSSSAETLRAVRLIDMVIDEAIARCFKSYTDGRLQELEQLQSQLKLTNQELTRLVQASRTNLAQLAHELKTPLTSIIGYSDLFLRQHRQETQVKDSMPNLESIERVLRGGRQLLHLINDALEISRYDAGKMLPQGTLIDIKMLLQGIVEMVEPQANAKKLKLVLNAVGAPNQVMTDPLRLQQIVVNLVSNAIRYSESGKIELICRQLSDQQWAIAVSDEGLGISTENQAHIFEPYFQGRQRQDPESTGLGLAIVARLVSLLQGKIELNSEVGFGSTFTVIFPIELRNDTP